MEEEGQQRDSELWDGLDDEIDRLAPSPERLRDISIFSPQRAFTGSCADQVLSRTPDLFAIECEWASFPMYSPQRSPNGCCADQEQSLGVRYASNMTMSSGSSSSRNFEEAHEGTSKRWCWENGITRWNGDGCSLIELKLLLNNSVHQNSWGSEPPEVRPLQQRNDGVVIPINEETERIEAMARKGKSICVGEGNENSQVRPLQQINNGVVIRDDTEEQNVYPIPWISEVQPVRDTNIGAVFGANELDQNGIQIPEVQPLQQRINGVVIHNDNEEQNVNLIPINEETKRTEAMARKGKSTYVCEGNDNSQGYPLEERCVEVENLMDENIRQKVERAEKSCISISHSKKKKRTDTPKRKYKKRLITLDDLRPLFGQTRAEAAKTLGVSKSTFKRYCRDNGIPWWNGEGCSLVEPKPLNNSVHQNSLGFKPPEVQGEKETSALLRAREDVVKVKAIYGEATVNLWLSSESGVVELKEKVAEGVGLELGSFNVKFQDEDEDWVLIACDKDLRNCMKISSSLGNQVIRLQVTKVSNSEKSCKSCKGLKRKMP